MITTTNNVGSWLLPEGGKKRHPEKSGNSGGRREGESLMEKWRKGIFQKNYMGKFHSRSSRL